MHQRNLSQLGRAVAVLVLGGLLAPGAFAGNQAMLELLQVLRDRGSITQAEYEMVRAAAEEEEGAVAASGDGRADPADTDRARVASTPAPEPSGKPGADLPRIDHRRQAADHLGGWSPSLPDRRAADARRHLVGR